MLGLPLEETAIQLMPFAAALLMALRTTARRLTTRRQTPVSRR